MAKSDSTAAHLGLLVTSGMYATSFEGTREELIKEGICTDEHFPEGRKRVQYGGEGFEHWSIKRIKGERFIFYQSHQRREKAQERGSEYESPEAWQAAHEDFVERLLRMVDLTVTGESERLAFGETTIRFDDATQKRINAAIHEIESAIRCGSAVWTGSARWAKRNPPKAPLVMFDLSYADIPKS